MDELKQKIEELENRIDILESKLGIEQKDEGVHVFPMPELMIEKRWDE